MGATVSDSTTIPRADVSARDGGRAEGSANVVAAIERTVAATSRAAALACRPWVGRGDKKAADAPVVTAGNVRRVVEHSLEHPTAVRAMSDRPRGDREGEHDPIRAGVDR
jgi:hypothetical protein